MKGKVIDALARMDKDVFIDGSTLADSLHVCPRTLRRMVLRYELPEGTKQGNRKFWRVGLLLQWFENREREQLKKAEEERKRILNFEGAF